uniref:BTB domain-containing protein n=1 Tax=Ganoderma boninense TaxID=34458 RepID=A0A5K1K4P4_9APHY|nr:Uncharacterized protein [Ganoderma boninense]
MCDSDVRPLKRTRHSTDDHADSQGPSLASFSVPSPNLKRHPEIWYDNGNLVLVARETAFRIYRGLITGQSTVFSDLFISSTSCAEETFEGCPVIHVSDSPQDLAHLLRVLLPRSHIHYRTKRADPAPPFNEISAVVRLAHKVQLRYVLTAFCSPPDSYLSLSPSENIGVVNLARLTETPSLLPLALYECAYHGSAIFDGWTREDGTVEHLSGPDIRRCVDARGRLADERAAFISRLFDETISTGCRSHDTCFDTLVRVHRNAVRSEHLAHSADVLCDWELALELLEEENTLCSSCVGELVERNRTERKKVFDKLPQIFDITVEGWGMDDAEVEAGAVPGQG